MNPSADRSPPALDYAAPSTDGRVLYSLTEEGATVVIRQPGRRLRAAADGTAGLLGEAALYLIAVGGFLIWRGAGWQRLALMVVPVIAGIVGCVFGLAWLWHWGLAWPIVIELTPTELVFSNLDARGSEREMPRDRIYAIKYVSHSKNLVVRIRDIEMFECHLELPPAEIERIVVFLRSTIGLNSSTESAA